MKSLRPRPRPHRPERPRRDDRKDHPIDPPPENETPIDEPHEERQRRDEEKDRDHNPR